MPKNNHDKESKVLFISYGQGGHQEEMRRLLNKIEPLVTESTQLIILTDSDKPLKTSLTIKKKIIYQEVRDKHSLFKTMINLPKTIIKQVVDTINILINQPVDGIVITGPGVSIIPAIVCKFCGKKVVVFESWCRFEHKSLTGKLLYRFSDLFFVQNKSMKALYKNSIYKGRL